MADGGYVKLHRRTLEGSSWGAMDPNHRAVFVGLLLAANWKPTTYQCRRCGTLIDVPPGGFATPYRELAERLKTPPNMVYRALSKLLRLSVLVRPVCGRCHALYVFKNWEEFQGCEATPKQHRSNTEAQPEQRQLYEEREEGEEGEEQRSPSKDLQLELVDKKPSPSKPRRQKSKQTPGVQSVLKGYYELYQEYYPTPPTLTWGGASRKTAEMLLKGPPARTPDEVLRLARGYLGLGGKPAEEGHPFGLLPYHIDKINARSARVRSRRGDPNS